MKTDCELLNLAAKAAGIEVYASNNAGLYIGNSENDFWQPLTDDGDALRLAVVRKIFRCHMDLFHQFYEVEIAAGCDECAATRRAIVRAAAAIGEAMP